MGCKFPPFWKLLILVLAIDFLCVHWNLYKRAHCRWELCSCWKLSDLSCEAVFPVNVYIQTLRPHPCVFHLHQITVFLPVTHGDQMPSATSQEQWVDSLVLLNWTVQLMQLLFFRWKPSSTSQTSGRWPPQASWWSC